jgi:hypothetical protein
MARSRDDDDDYDDDEPAKKKRRREDDDDDYDDRPSRSKRQLSGLEGMYANTNFAVLILFSLCCNGLCALPLILSAIAFSTSTDPTAKNNAKICLIISGVMVVIGVIANVIRFSIGGNAGMR